MNAYKDTMFKYCHEANKTTTIDSLRTNSCRKQVRKQAQFIFFGTQSMLIF